MAVSDAATYDHCAALIALLESLPTGSKGFTCPNPETFDWGRLARLAGDHGLSGLLYKSISQNPKTIDPEAYSRLVSQYLLDRMRNAQALNELEQIAEAFEQKGLRLIVLKGASALLWLYDDLGCRRLGDLDLAVEEAALPDVHGVMRALGYSQHRSPRPYQDEILDFRHSHLPEYSKEGKFAVEIHGTILSGRGEYGQAMPEIWEQSLPIQCGDVGLRTLCPSHFFLHAAVHSMKHIQGLSYCFRLKDIADMILVTKKCRSSIDWDALWVTAARWGIAEDVRAIAATLNQNWTLQIPAPFALDAGFPARMLVFGPRSRSDRLAIRLGGRRATQRLLSEFANLKSSHNTSAFAGLRYLYRLIVRRPEDMRKQYDLSEDTWLAPYYLRRIVEAMVVALDEWIASVRLSR